MYNPTPSEQNRRRKLCHEQGLLFDDDTGKCVKDTPANRHMIGYPYISFEELRKKNIREEAGAKAKAKTFVSKTGLDALTVVELKQKARDKGLKGYSRMKRAELLKLLRNVNGKSAKKTPVKKTSAKKASSSMTVVQLRALCKKKGITRYSKLNKAKLIRKCNQ